MKKLILFAVVLLTSCAMPKQQPNVGDTSIVCVFAKCDVGARSNDISTPAPAEEKK
jgi:hypothetical protein